VLPRQPGSREARYAHLLGGPVEAASRDSGVETRGHTAGEQGSGMTLAARVAELEAEVAALRAAVARIEDRLESSSGSN
jgi:uncharacterized protein YceH (UPF0502 family)